MKLTRVIDGRGQTLGRLGEFYTLENPWRDNEPYVSCIPAGSYEMKRSFYNRGGYDCFEAENVPGRTQILIHIGNSERDTSGCILIGERVGVIGTSISVLQSGAAFTKFMKKMEGIDEFTLDIVEFSD